VISADKSRMKRLTAIFCIFLSLSLAADELASQASAQSSGEIVVAQDNGPGGFFRRLFGGRRQQRPPPRAPFKLFPDFEQPERAPARQQPRRQRKARAVAPQPREPAAVEKAADAKRALVVGDFMAGAMAKGLTDAYRHNANIVVIDASNGSSGLVRDDYYNWSAKIPELVAEQKADAILMMIGGNDRQTIHGAAGDQEFGSDFWRATYTARVVALADALKATGKPVFWGGLVPVASSAMSRDYSAFNGIVREQVEARGLKYVDMWNGFADEDGKYVAFGPDVRGQSVQLRADDGLNFTRAGQRKLAYFVEQDLNDAFGQAAPIVATVTPGAASPATGNAPRIGPMVPLEALSVMGGEALSGGVSEGERGNVARAISGRATAANATPPPKARVDAPTPVDAEAPRNGLAHARALADAGLLADAHVDVMRWLADHPVDAEAWYLLGLVESAGGRFDAADQAFVRVLYLDRDPEDALAQRIGLAERLGHRDQARELRARAARQRGRGSRA